MSNYPQQHATPTYSYYPPYSYATHSPPYVVGRPYLVDDYFNYYRNMDRLAAAGYHQQAAAESAKYIGRHEHYLFALRILAYIQIFIGGVLLVTDISYVVLLWNFSANSELKLEMISQLLFPIVSLCIALLSLAVSLNPTHTLARILSAVLIAAIIPTLIFPKNTSFVTAAAEAIEVSRASDTSWRNTAALQTSMIRSETHNKMLRLISLGLVPSRSSFGDLYSLPPDLLLILQYLLITYAIFSFIQLFIHIFALYYIVRLLLIID